MCFVIFVYFSKTKFGVLGGSFIILSHGICSSGLFSGANQIVVYSHSRSLVFNSSYLKLWPRFSLFWFVFCLANLGGPPTINFFGEVICLITIVQIRNFCVFPVIILTFFSAGYSIILYRNTQYGRLRKNKFIYLLNMFELRNFIHLIFLLLILFFIVF